MDDATPHKTVIQVTVLSNGPLRSPEDLSAIAYEITEGDCSGQVDAGPSVPLSRREVALALQAQGSDPEFLLMDDGWKYALEPGDEVTCSGREVKIGSIQYFEPEDEPDSVEIVTDSGEKLVLLIDEIE